MHLYKLFTIIFLLFVASTHAQTLVGKVIDPKQNLTLESVLVHVENKLIATETNELGVFNIQLDSTVKPTFALVFKLENYQTKKIIIENITTDTLIIPLEEEIESTQLEDVVISGTMSERRLMDSPIAVEVYSPALFKRNPSPSVFEALNMINGVQPQINCNVCNTGDIHINGLEGPYTMVLIDGMPIMSSLATVYGFQGIPQSLIKRVEVVKGPSSTLYGSEAVAGLVNIITKDPQSVDKFSTDISATSLGELNLDVATKYKISKNVIALLGGNYFNYQIPKDINNDGFTDVTQQNRISLFNKFSFLRKNNKKSSFSARLVMEDRWGGQLGYTKLLRGSDSIYAESIITNRVEAIGTYELPIKENIRFDYSYNYHHQDSYYGITKYNAEQHIGFAQMVWNKNINLRWQMVSGLPLRITRYDDNTSATSKANLTILPGIFTQSEYKFTNKHTALFGLRYDYNSYHGSIFTPRLSYKFSPNVKSVIRLTMGSGYRVVNVFTEEHASLTGARNVDIKNNLKPEKSWNVNMNYSKQIIFNKHFVSLDASAFYTLFTNKIIPDYTTDAQKIIYDNIEGYAVSRGISVNSDFQHNSGLRSSLGLNFLDVFKYDKKHKTPQMLTPKAELKFTLGYKWKPYNIIFDITGDIKSPMHLPVVPNDFRPSKSPTFALIGCQITKSMKKTEYYLGAKNILNFIPQHALLRPNDPFDKTVDDLINNPFGYTFDTSYNYAALQGTKIYFGVRYSF